ncbi:MAG: hypothetical protein GF308_09370, partial [Candidatus Heimdallarchaeota archaeon]|nr:hypothetical protein [Candidatus Heimdallarchaeota archaeon]
MFLVPLSLPFVQGEKLQIESLGVNISAKEQAFEQTLPLDSPVLTRKSELSPTLNFSTFLGGGDPDGGLSIAVNPNNGSWYVAGATLSSDFPTLNAAQENYAGGTTDVFVAKFSSSGSLLWSTYFGGSGEDQVDEIAVDPNDGSCYVTGWTNSADFPIMDANQSTFGGGDYDVFLSKFSSSGSLLWSTFLGGTGMDFADGITVNNNGSCYVIGTTNSTNFP